MFQSWMFGRGADREKTQQEQDQEEERFRVSMEEPGKFEDALDVVDEADESTAIALLGCACLTERSPGTSYVRTSTTSVLVQLSPEGSRRAAHTLKHHPTGVHSTFSNCSPSTNKCRLAHGDLG